MLETLKQRSVKLEWLSSCPKGDKKNALLIPVYNESSNCDLHKRLMYFKEMATEFKDELDVIIINDGSTDDSLERIASFNNIDPNVLFVASIYPNANKVGALFLTVLSITHEFILLSDFDTDIVGMEDMKDTIDLLKNDKMLMGCYFRMLPFEGYGTIFRFQQLEYSLIRSLYKFHQREQSVPVMPGAGCCYKREVLISIYREHSGLRSGEDREATLIGLKLGYRTIYRGNVLTLTRPPLTFRSLVRQRIRWNLGYLETFSKERKYYFSQISTFTRVGMRVLMDIIINLSILSILPAIAVGAIINFQLVMFLSLAIYTGIICWCVNLLYQSPEEISGLGKGKVTSILLFPFLKITVEYFAWMGAILQFFKKQASKGRTENHYRTAVKGYPVDNIKEQM